MAVQRIITATPAGIDAALVEVEADVSNGLPMTIIVGLPDAAVQESRERIRSAIKHSGFAYPQTRVSLNLAPGSLPKIGTHFDLPIALAVMLAGGILPNKISGLERQLIVGELSLDGTVKPTAGVLAMVEAAARDNFDAVFVPKDSAAMAALVRGLNVYPVGSLAELAAHISGQSFIEPVRAALSLSGLTASPPEAINDFCEINGQTFAKRALEVAAAGGHNILLVGPPGSGKTMLAKALPGIMPPLAPSEILELTKIYNSAGRTASEVVSQRPFRSPHHTASQMALVGGGGIPRPGEVTLSHYGVLFLDELPEFSRAVLEVLRQPLEERSITITRARHSYTFPAAFILVAAHNPCPCGNFGQNTADSKLQCDCHPAAIDRYRKKISGPLLDRIDLHINVPRLQYSEMFPGERTANSVKGYAEPSRAIQARVIGARLKQAKRFQRAQTNAAMTVKELRQFCVLDEASSELLEQAAEKYQLSGRAIHRIQKVARTIADLANSEKIRIEHLAESLQYRLREQAGA